MVPGVNGSEECGREAEKQRMLKLLYNHGQQQHTVLGGGNIWKFA